MDAAADDIAVAHNGSPTGEAEPPGPSRPIPGVLHRGRDCFDITSPPVAALRWPHLDAPRGQPAHDRVATKAIAGFGGDLRCRGRASAQSRAWWSP